MPGDPSYFFDTYALLERQRGNEAYAAFKDAPIFTHQYNLYEFATIVSRGSSEARARDQLALLNANLIEADTEDLFDAIRFNLAHRKLNLSYVDCLGYALAKRHGKRFLTGDPPFKTKENVEFVR